MRRFDHRRIIAETSPEKAIPPRAENDRGLPGRPPPGDQRSGVTDIFKKDRKSVV
jgi:hypothetical protein